ncbi:MAG: hypothetical protein WC647_17390 [Desulfomonilaceae bacterium]|jgi:hypothetical protein
MSTFRTLRFVERELSIENYDDLLTRKRHDLLTCCRSLPDKATVIQTCGGCLRLIMDMSAFSHGKATTNVDFKNVVSVAEEAAFDLFLPKTLQEALAEACNYLTLGVDVYHEDGSCDTHAELVGVYDTRGGCFVAWTGKSYPVQFQTSSLMYCKDLESHFLTLSGVSVMLLGCHDLNIFSPRSRASASQGTYKDQIMNKMDRLVKIHDPVVVLHHPHYTDSPRIWRVPWTGVDRNVPYCDTYSSGIFYGAGDGGKPRGRLEEVLAKTAKGDVKNWIQDLPKIS